MGKFFRRIGRYFREGFWGVIRHGAMALSSASAVTITLTLISVFLMFFFNVGQFTNSLEATVLMQARVEYSCDEACETQIRSQLEKLEGVTSITYSSAEDELEFFISEYDADNDFGYREIYAGQSPMHAAYYMEVESGTDLQALANQIEGIEGVYDAYYGGEGVVKMVDALDSVRYGGVILVASLSALAIFLISNTIKLTIYARNKEIAIMRAVGASNADIRFPYVIEGILIGILGSLLPVGFSVFGYIYLYTWLGGVLLTDMLPMIPPHPFVLYLSAGLVAAGMLVGLLGSFFSVSKYLRWKR